jgi:hypothetical protein
LCRFGASLSFKVAGFRYRFGASADIKVSIDASIEGARVARRQRRFSGSNFRCFDATNLQGAVDAYNLPAHRNN